MRHVIRNNKPSTYNIEFFDRVNKFTIYNEKNEVYYYRYLPDDINSISVNIPDTGIYHFELNGDVKMFPLRIAKEIYDIKLPKQERNREKEYHIVHDNKLTGTPALIYTETGLIVTGREFKKYPPPIRVFILLHEIGHFKYETEKYCDLYAFTEFVKMGYNPSTGMYCLTDILKRSVKNDERIMFLYNQLLKYELIK